MKRTTLKRIGRQGKINLKSNQILKKIYADKGIKKCEIGFPGCMEYWGLAPAHRHKRYFYKSKPELLSSFNQTVLACSSCHQKIEGNKELTEEVFNNLRGNESE